MFTDNLLSYRIPEGSDFQSGLRPTLSNLVFENVSNHLIRDNPNLRRPFADTCYDGYRIEPGSLLDGGLGCLVDLNRAALDSKPRFVESNSNWHFVGWHRDRWRHSDGKHRDLVDMLFKFESLRNFTHLKIFVSNNFVDKVSVFRLNLFFCLNYLIISVFLKLK